MTTWRLVNSATGAVVVEHMEAALGFWSRFRGLQWRAPLPAGSGLLLVPCKGIHTFFVRSTLDVVMLDAAGKVLRVCRGVKPWRIAFAPRATHAVLELPAGHVQVEPGEKLSVDPSTTAGPAPPRKLRFLFPADY